MSSAHQPRFSVITPVYEPPRGILRNAIESVRRQTFPDWELCLVDDASTSPTVRHVLEEASADSRIRVHHRKQRGGIVAASNDALSLARGEFVAFLDHDDELHPDALRRLDEAIDDDVDYVYTDEDKLDADGRHLTPFYKPDWSPERFRCQMYTCHLSAARRALVDQLGGMRPEYEGAQDYDLFLRVTERARRVVHVPEVLYHWRMIGSSVAGDEQSKPHAYEAGTRAIAAHLDRTGFPAKVERDEAHSGVYRLTPALQQTPLVSIIIPTAGLARVVRGETMNLVVNCVESILSKSTYREYEIICVIDGQTSAGTRNALMSFGDPRVRLVEYLLAFNFARKINFGAAHSRGDYLLLLNDDTQVITPNWIESMLCYAQTDRVGAVGAKLMFSDGRIQHVGVVAVDGNPGHPYYNFPADSTGYANNLLVPQNCVAVTAACLMSPRRAFEEVGGLSLSFPMNYNDVDYCLKLGHLGYRVVFNPDVRLYHYEASSRMTGEVADEELHLLQSRWGSILRNDPYYNPNFIDGSANFVHPVYLSDGSTVPA